MGLVTAYLQNIVLQQATSKSNTDHGGLHHSLIFEGHR